jgi:hypothetical protein
MMVTARWLSALAFTWSDSILLPSLGLIAVLLIGAGVIVLIRRWRGQDDTPSQSPAQQLAQYRSLYDQGVMSKDEYDSLRAMLEGKTRAELRLSAGPVRGPQSGSVQAQPLASNSPPAAQNHEEATPPPAPQAGNGQI